ncbi:hypothetical protein RFI_05427, partial [Reticulomyxa filosa]
MPSLHSKTTAGNSSANDSTGIGSGTVTASTTGTAQLNMIGNEKFLSRATSDNEEKKDRNVMTQSKAMTATATATTTATTTTTTMTTTTTTKGATHEESSPIPLKLFHIRDMDFMLVYWISFQSQWQQLIADLLQEYRVICAEIESQFETPELRVAITKVEAEQSYLECLVRLESTLMTGREVKDDPWIRLESNRRNTKKFGQDLRMHELMRQLPDLNAQNNHGKTALQIALSRSAKEPAFAFVARYLAQQHVVTGQMIKDGRVIIDALKYNNPFVVEILLSLEPKLSAKDDYGRTGMC